MGGVGFKGDFGVGCADSSTLSSAPRSTGGYASLHTFTSVRIRAHTHARRSRNWLTRGGYPSVLSLFFSTLSRLLGSSILAPLPPPLRRTRTHVNTHTHSSRLFASLCALVTLCSFVSVCASAESEALTRTGRIVCTRAFGTRACQLVAIGGVQRSLAS